MDCEDILTESARDALCGFFLERISNLEPDLAEDLTDMIMELEDEDLLRMWVAWHPYLYPSFTADLSVRSYLDNDAFQARVQRCKASLLSSSTANPGEEANSGDETILTPSSSSWAAWSPRADPITQRDGEGPQTAVGAQEHKIKQGSEDSAGTAGDSDATKEVVVESPTQSQHDPRQVVETIRDPAKLNTMKEAVASPASLTGQCASIETARGHEPLDALASSSTVSYVLRGHRATTAPASPAPQEDVGKSAPGPPRSPIPDTADQSHPALETEAPASMPLMEAISAAEAAAAAAPRGTRRSANTGARGQWTDNDCERIAVLSFCCGVTVASGLIWCCGP